MKRSIIACTMLALTACQPADQQYKPPQEIAADDPRRTEADARHANTPAGASGIAGIAIVSGNQNGNDVNMIVDARYSTPAEIAGAPKKVCASLNGTVKSFRNEGDPSGNFELHKDFIRYLYIECDV